MTTRAELREKALELVRYYVKAPRGKTLSAEPILDLIDSEVAEFGEKVKSEIGWYFPYSYRESYEDACVAIDNLLAERKEKDE